MTTPLLESDRLLEAIRLTSEIWEHAPIDLISKTEFDVSSFAASLACLKSRPPDIGRAFQLALEAAKKHKEFRQFSSRVTELHSFLNQPTVDPFTQGETFGRNA